MKSGTSSKQPTKLPDYAGQFQHSDGAVVGADGNTDTGIQPHQQQAPAG